MRTAASLALWIVRLGGVFQLVVGLLLWTGRARSLVPTHMAVGTAVAVALLVLAAAAARAGASRALVAGAVAWAVLAVAVGIGQLRVAPGAGRWAVQVAHLLIGLALLGWGDRLGRALRAPATRRDS